MVEGIDAPIDSRRVTSEDGTRLTYHVIGRGPGRWVIPPGMATPLISMKYILEAFQQAYTMITWDLRGFYGSTELGDPDALGVLDHVKDLRAILAAEKLDGGAGTEYVLGGWSMGVQISLEHYHQIAGRGVRALVLIHGAYERALATALPTRYAEAILRPALRFGRHLGPVLNPASRALLKSRLAPEVMKQAGMLHTGQEFFRRVLDQYRMIDWGRNFDAMLQLHEHSAAAYLPEVRVPALITAGGRDLLTPVALAEKMHRAIRGSELFVVPDGTHYSVVEYPEMLVARIEEFLRKNDPASWT